MSLLVLIAGGSGSGKTTLARRLAQAFPSSLLSIDDYYRGFHDIALEQRRLLNFDAPAAIEDELLAAHLRDLLVGGPIERPIYDHAAFVRRDETLVIAPAPVILLEGLFALAWEPIRAMASLRVYVDTAEETCFRRRLQRDIEQFHRSSEDALLRYHTHVRPNQERYVMPTRQFADLVVTTDDHEDGAFDTVSTWICKNLLDSC